MKKIALITLCVFTNCVSQKQTVISKEKIDLKHIEKLRLQADKQNQTSWSSGDTLFSVVRYSQRDQITISQELLSTGDVVHTDGQVGGRMVTVEYNRSQPTIVRKYFYPSGQLRWRGEFHSEKYLKEERKEREYPIGDVYEYSESGTLIRHYKVEDELSFNFDDVKRKIKEIDKNATITIVKLDGDIRQTPIWRINFVSSENGLGAADIDGKSGKIIRQGKNIKMYE